jgi:thioredoxin 1
MASNAILEVTDSNFDQTVLKSEQPVMVDFWAPWCGPCRALAPVVDELATSYQGKVKVTKLNVDNNPSTANRYQVTGIPTLLIFKNGQLQDQLVGYKPKEEIERALTRHL